MPTTEQLAAQLDRVAAFESGPFPVLSLYLNMQPDQHGRDNFEPFLRKELAGRLVTFAGGGPEHESLDQDAEKALAYVAQVDSSANGLALFACSGVAFFEAVTLAAPIQEHRLYISDRPHLYPLARVIEEFPRYAVLVADTHSARLFVVAGHAIEQTGQVEGVKTRRHKSGGWSQARFQRHIDNYHAHHAKDVVEALARIVRDEQIEAIVISGDDVIVPLLKEHLPKDLAARVVDVMNLGVRAPDREVLEATLAVMQKKDAETDRERVDALLSAYRSNGLGIVGVENTRLALEMGQVDELVIAAVPDSIDAGATASRADEKDRTAEERAADELVTKARQTAATIRFIQDPSLLAGVGGAGAFLRFKL